MYEVTKSAGTPLLSNFNDVFWNTESIYRSLKKKKVAKVIAQAIADYEMECD